MAGKWEETGVGVAWRYYRRKLVSRFCELHRPGGFYKIDGLVVADKVTAAHVKPQGNSDIKFALGEETPLPLGEIVKKIQILESSGGKYNYSKCEAMGKYNRYGFGIPGNGKYQCFEKDGDTKAVLAWFEDKIKKHDLESAACGYNTGKFEKGCSYFQRFMSI